MIYYGNNDYRDYLAHHGILGMHWGIRRYQPYSIGYQREGGEKGKFVGGSEKTANASASKTQTPSIDEAKSFIAETMSDIPKHTISQTEYNKKLAKIGTKFDKDDVQTFALAKGKRDFYVKKMYSTIQDHINANPDLKTEFEKWTGDKDEFYYNALQSHPSKEVEKVAAKWASADKSFNDVSSALSKKYSPNLSQPIPVHKKHKDEKTYLIRKTSRDVIIDAYSRKVRKYDYSDIDFEADDEEKSK